MLKEKLTQDPPGVPEAAAQRAESRQHPGILHVRTEADTKTTVGNEFKH